MNTSDQTTAATVLPPAPYVGMRPFEKTEKKIFFGRNQDAALLRDKVFSARITVLYGTSGTGKSSILRALVVPSLETEDARVIYFDNWTSSDPTADLKAKLIKEANELGLLDLAVDTSTLAELVRLLISVDQKIVVLVLDQFEEFFTHDKPLEPLSQELGALVRLPDLDARVLLSLREEHLASLEPLKTTIPNLFQSIFRLETLNLDGAREAIQHPVELFGGGYEPDLMDFLMADLRQERRVVAVPPHILPEKAPGEPSAKPAVAASQPLPAAYGPVDLTMLQLVCDELWKEAKKRQQVKITLSLYKELKGKAGILQRFLNRVMPRSWGQQCLTARLMEYLAPPEGFKISLPADYLAKIIETPLSRAKSYIAKLIQRLSLANLIKIKTPLARVKSELERLSGPDSRVLRSRTDESGLVLYELRHDRFIPIITAWRDKVLKRLRRWGVASTVVVIVLAAFLGDYLILHHNIEGEFQSDRSFEQKFDNVAEYLLWRRTAYAPLELFKNRSDRLRDYLKEHQSQLPPHYGLDLSGLEFVALPDKEKEEILPLTLRYSGSRKLDERIFLHSWQKEAKSITEKWGIPVPAKLLIVRDVRYPKDLVKVVGWEIRPLELEIPAHEKDAFFNPKLIPAPGKEFFDRFRGEWTFIKDSPDIIVPRWSLPAWRTFGVKARDGNGFPAVCLTRKLLQNPDRLLTPSVVEILLDRVTPYRAASGSVSEARVVRGDRLPQDFQEIVKRGLPLTHLSAVLDILANYPEKSSVEVADIVASDLSSAQATLPPKLWGPRAASSPGVEAMARKPAHQAYQEAAKWLPPLEPPIRVFLGKDMVPIISTGVSPEERRLKLEIFERLEKVRDRLWRRFGFLMPGVRFRDPTWDPSLHNQALRIELLGQNKEHESAKELRVSQEEALERLGAALEIRAALHRVRFLTVDEVHRELNELPPALQAWLKERYSLTDLKLLLRAVINPSPEEVSHWNRALTTGDIEQKFSFPAGNNIRAPAWLLASLAFWSQIHDPMDLPAMAKDLQMTQQARLQGKLGDSQGDEKNAGDVARGAQALSQDHLDIAANAFAQAIKVDQDAAVKSFLVLYAQEFQRSLFRQFTGFQDFGIEGPPKIERAERIEVEDLLAKEGFYARHGWDIPRRLRLCLLASYSEDYQKQARRALAKEIGWRHSGPEKWPPGEAAWYGLQVLNCFDPLEDDASIAQSGFSFLLRALPQLKNDQAYKVIDKVLQITDRPGPNQWCWNLLPALAASRREPIPAINIALNLSDREVQADLHQALSLADQAQNMLQDFQPQKEKERLLAWTDFVRARSLVRLSAFGPTDRLPEAESILKKIEQSREVGGMATSQLALLKIRENHLEEAITILDAAIKQRPDDADLYGVKLRVHLAAGNREALSQTAKEAHGKIKKDFQGKVTGKTQGFAFIEALGLLTTQSTGWEQAAKDFLQTDNENVPYVAMMLYSRLSGKDKNEALRTIKRQWDQAHPQTWRERLRQGDQTVWREMLIGYYLREPVKTEYFEDLKEEARFANSELRQVPMPRRGLLCEYYFYDALLAESEGDKKRMKLSLEEAVRTGVSNYFEYAMARFLLAQPEMKDLK